MPSPLPDKEVNMPEQKIKVLHGYGFPDLVLYQKDHNTLTVRDEVDGEVKKLEVAINLEARVGDCYVNGCVVAPS